MDNQNQTPKTSTTNASGGSEAELIEYVHKLPTVLREAYEGAKPKWDNGADNIMLQGTFGVIDTVTAMLVGLSGWYSPEQFGAKSAKEYFDQLTQTLYAKHESLSEPEGAGSGGTIVRLEVAWEVLQDLQRTVVEMVQALLEYHEGFDMKSWETEWSKAGQT